MNPGAWDFMHKFLSFTIILIFANLCPIVAEIPNVDVEIRSAAFFHSSKRFREIYGNVGGSYQLEVSTYLCDNFVSWVNFDWYSKHKKSKECASRIRIENISFGIKYPYQFCNFTAYVGIGPSISRVFLKNKTRCCRRERLSKLAFGGILKTGVNYFITEDVFLDLFFDYLYQPIHFDTWVDIGGIKTGVGVGIGF